MHALIHRERAQYVNGGTITATPTTTDNNNYYCYYSLHL